MAARSYILYPGSVVWRFCATDASKAGTVEIPFESGASAAETAAAVCAALRLAGYDGGAVLLAVPSGWCLCAAVATGGLPAKNRRQALAYRLEEKVPIAAEEFVADFISIEPDDSQTLGVCLQSKSIALLIEALEANGVAIASIVPAALLRLQQVLTWLPDGDLPSALVWADAGATPSLELFILHRRRPIEWYVIPDDAKDLLAHLGLSLYDAPSPVVATIGLRPELAASLRPRFDVRILDSEKSGDVSALAGQILSGRTQPLIELRRDALAHRDPLRPIFKPLVYATAAVMLLLVCAAAAMLLRANRYERIATQLADQQTAVFRQVFPSGDVPTDVQSRLAAEAKGLQGVSGDDSAPKTDVGGLVMLRDLMTRLPADDALRYRLLELRLEERHFSLEGETLTHGDADLIAASLRRGNIFVVESPRTEQLGSADSVAASDKSDAPAKGVAFTIAGASPSSPLAERRASR